MSASSPTSGPTPGAAPTSGLTPGRAALWFALPTLLLLALEVLPLVTGAETLILRDVLEVHLMLKAPQAEALREGALPLIDPSRFGGQPSLGNPNAVPLYPDNLLYLLFPVLWVLNAHFWVHLLLAPVSAFWMGRAWGLTRPAAWATGVCYALSGFFLSHLNFYNLVAGAALAPALVAAVLRAGQGRRRAAPAAGALWALLLLSGDPLMAVLAGALALGAFAAQRVRGGREGGGVPGLEPGHGLRRAGGIGLAVLCGTLVALPQIVEFLRVLPATYRGYWGYGAWRLSVGTWQPLQAIEWLVPMAFGRYDLQGAGGFWAAPLFGGHLPLFLSLYPGALALALVLAAGLPGTQPDRGGRRAAWWAWGAIAVGLLLSTGGATPIGRWLFALPLAESFRYPVKLWLLVALGAALLCGIGWQRAFGGAGGGGRPVRRSLRRLGIPLAGLALALGGVLAVLTLAPGRFEGAILAAAREGLSPALVHAERARWIATVVAVLALILCSALALVLARRRPVAGTALLLVVHAAGQLYLLRGLTATDEVAFYREPPAAVASIPPGSRIAHAEYGSLFGPSRAAPGPDSRLLWTLRQDFAALIPPAGVLHGYRYELNRSPEGLSSFLGRFAYEMVSDSGTGDLERVRALSRWGVETVIAEEPLVGVPPAWARLVRTWPGVTAPVHVYRLPRAAPEVLFAETALRAPHLNAAWDLLSGAGMDPDLHAVVPGDEDDPVPVLAGSTGERPPPGRARVLRTGPESIEVETESAVPGVLVVQRSHLPLWRGTVDGDAVAVEPVNLYRLGVRVPAGVHRVRLGVDRRPLVASLAGSGAGAAGLLLLTALGGWRRIASGRSGPDRSAAGEPVDVQGPAQDV